MIIISILFDILTGLVISHVKNKSGRIFLNTVYSCVMHNVLITTFMCELLAEHFAHKES